MEEQWIHDLRKKMATHQAPVPPGLWENIQSALPSPQPAPKPLHGKIKRWTTGAVGLAAALTMVFLLHQRQVTVQTPPTVLLTAARPNAASAGERDFTIHEEALALQSATSIAIQGTATPSTTPVSQQTATEEAIPLRSEDQPAATVNESIPQSSLQKAPSTEKTFSNKNARIVRHALAETSNKELLATADRSHKRSWAIALYAANRPHTSHQTKGYSEFVSGTALPQDFSTSHTPVKDLIYSNLGKEIATRKKHHLPLQFGLSARYYLTPRFSFESGITYTYLSSKLISGTADHHFSTEQHLHYLGIPLRVNFDVWKNRLWNFYLSGGGSLEKCIHGQSATDFVINHQRVSSTEQSVMERPLQCAIGGAIGAQVNFTPHIGLYAEPGVRYYFDNGSPVETIYKDQPFNFHFKLGLRIQFH